MTISTKAVRKKEKVRIQTSRSQECGQIARPKSKEEHHQTRKHAEMVYRKGPPKSSLCAERNENKNTLKGRPILGRTDVAVSTGKKSQLV